MAPVVSLGRKFMKKIYSRVPRNYNGNQPTGRPIHSLLPKVLKNIQKKIGVSEEVIMQAFVSVLGDKFAPMISSVRLEDGVLYVKVKNAALNSVIAGYERNRIIQEVRKALPGTQIQRIYCAIG